MDDGVVSREALLEATWAWYRALSDGDAGWIEAHLRAEANDVHIGAAEGYDWMSSSDLAHRLARQFQEVVVEWVAGEPTTHLVGSAGWVVDRPVLRFDDGSELQSRVSLVFVVDSDQLKLAHSHVSVATEGS